MQIGAAKSSPIPSGSEAKQQEYVPFFITDPTAEKPEDGKGDGRDELEKALNKINKTLELYSYDVKFAIHEQTHRLMVRVIDKKTDEVISEMPPTQILDMLAAFQEMVGLIVDKRV